ncbi:Putative uncharacterized protein FLJ37770 [Eumeta japonica]|uniref:Histone-lysine N-methyltransferase SETMAR n=1 Tax=Eumeta variegata TaxID=151549 RepID=A0A4C1Z9C9_EUMVA|nr:Putative uncharacterized protein FLJ37770 [Eumeta japonica]
MVSVLQESAPSYDGQKWARLFQQGRESCEDDPRAGRPVTVVTEENVRKIEKFVLADRRIKLWQIAEELQISKERVGEIIREHMNMKKISVRRIPKMLTPFDKQRRLQTNKDFLELVGDNIDGICDRIVTVDKPFRSIRKLNRSPCSERKKEKGRRRNSRFKSRHRSLWRQFWDSEGVLLIDYFKGDYYEWPILREFIGSGTRAVVQKRRGKLSRGVLFYKTMHLSTRRGFRGRP